jgi:hypothetical protein
VPYRLPFSSLPNALLSFYLVVFLYFQTIFQEAVSLDPRNPLAHFELAGLLAAGEEVEGALALYGTLTHLAPGEPSVFLQVSQSGGVRQLYGIGRAGCTWQRQYARVACVCLWL